MGGHRSDCPPTPFHRWAGLAARLWRAQGLRIVDAKKSKYNDAALAKFERARDWYRRAGRAAEWEETVRQVRAAHYRKSGLMHGFETLAAGAKRGQQGDRAQRAAALNPAVLDALIDEITVDAYGEDEQLWAFRQAFEDNVVVPCDGYLIGESVSVIEFNYDGNERRGLTAKCRRADGRQHILATGCDTVCRH